MPKGRRNRLTVRSEETLLGEVAEAIKLEKYSSCGVVVPSERCFFRRIFRLDLFINPRPPEILYTRSNTFHVCRNKGV